MFAAIAVMLFHLGYWSWVAPKNTGGSVLLGAASYPELAPFTFWGRFGVEIFFVISGLVIAYSADRSSVWRFFRSRILRLVPALLVCATVTLVVAKLIAWQTDAQLLDRYMRSISFSLYGPYIDGAYWTLGVEIVFYAVIVVLLAVRQVPRLEGIALIIGALSSVYWFWSWAGMLGLLPIPNLPFSGRDRQILLIDFGVYFALGVELWALRSKGCTAWRLTALAFLAVGGALGIIFTTPAYMHTLPAAFQLLPAAVWLVVVAFMTSAIFLDHIFTNNLSSRAMAWIRMAGLATYPLYLLHQLVGAVVLRLLVQAGVERFTALALAMLTVAAAALVVTLAVEPVVRRGVAAVIDWPQRRVAALRP